MTVQLYAGEWVEHNAESKVWNAISLAINSVNIIANGLVLVLFLTDRILRHDYRTYLFLNLALADIIWGAAAWVTEALSAHYGAFVTGPVGCQAVLSIASTGMAVSGQTFMWIAVDRYVSICLE
ncbi:hypothetical protein BC832DRAFT_190677 [Gaertneriomyces semiglobifer]|nr:hypothetical protein BC832DRAFT_190677 [Gaertneriomyces semiglobifer]